MEDTENSDKFDKFDFGVDFFAPPFSLAIVGDQEISEMWRLLYFQRTHIKVFWLSLYRRMRSSTNWLAQHLDEIWKLAEPLAHLESP